MSCMQHNCIAFILKVTAMFFFQFTYICACVPTQLHRPIGWALHISPTFSFGPLEKLLTLGLEAE